MKKVWEIVKKVFRFLVSKFKDPVFLTCLLIAALFLFLMKLDADYTTDVTVPVRIEGVEMERSADKDVKIQNNVVDISCRIKGKGYNLIKSHFAKVTIPSEKFVIVQDSDSYYVDMGTFENLFSNEMKDVEILRIYNKGIPLKSVVRFRKQVPVRSNINLDLSGQYMQIGQTFIEPSSVWVSGSKRDIENVTGVYTRELNIHNVEKQLSGNIPLIPIPNVELSEKEVFYSIDVERYTEFRQDNIGIQVKGHSMADDYIILPSTISVTYNMAQEAFKNGIEKGIVFYVDISNHEIHDKNSTYLGNNTYLIQHTPLPEGVEIREMSADKATVLRVR